MKWYVLTGIILSGSAAIGGLGYYIFRPKREEKEENAFEEKKPDAVRYLATPTVINNAGSSGFPLRKGSKGEYVRNLQNAIIKYFPDKNPLPKYGADGDWGSEVQTFLEKEGLLTNIDSTIYTDYITGNFRKDGSGTKSNPETTTASKPSIIKDLVKSVIPSYITDSSVRVGWQLWDTSKAKNLKATLALLQQLRSTTNYTSASSGFQYRPWELPFRKFTLVSGLFASFTSPSDKNVIRKELRRMGLKETIVDSDPITYDSTWSLAGLGIAHKNIRTKMKAIISDGFNIRVEIPTRTLLGQWLGSGNGYTRFRTQDGRDMYVRTNAVMFD
ncbi:hypothetical protein BH11BAC7_BH11BAC7_21290 [soil metagenome]